MNGINNDAINVNTPIPYSFSHVIYREIVA